MNRTRWTTFAIFMTAAMALAILFAATPRLEAQTAGAKSDGCKSCHQGIESMHAVGDDEIEITCVDCHGGNGAAMAKEEAHIKPKNRNVFTSSANPLNSYAVLNTERNDFIRFMNPGDFRVAHQTCGISGCHVDILNKTLKSLMAHSSMVPQSGLYNNGIHPAKIPVFGEAYMPDGSPAIISNDEKRANIKDTPESELAKTSLTPKLEPIPTFEMIPAPDALRLLERGNNDAGTRGPGTDFHIAGGGIVLHKTRLNDPTLWFIGTNQTAGDYRQSGCTACHVLYLNDRDKGHSGPELAEYIDKGVEMGHSASADQSIPKDEAGHPVKHQFTRRVPISQCLTCHHHQGNGALGNYVGAMWWDQETDADKILAPGSTRDRNNVDAQRRRNWDDNPEFDDVQIEDWHGHGWNFRRVYSRDRSGNLLDKNGNVVANDDPDRFKKAVHLQDIHYEAGMHCIDCHTQQDIHGDGNIWGAMIDGIEITCDDCHGTVLRRANLVTSGVPGGTDLGNRTSGPRTQWGERVFEMQNNKIIQRSKMVEGLQWEVPQLLESADRGSKKYNERAARAHSMLRDGTYGKKVSDPSQLAHSDDSMECYACHSSWNTQCYGCHLSADVNRKADEIHFGDKTSRAYVMYSPQMLRADGFLLGKNGSSKGSKYSPMRSASAVFISARDRGRNEVVHQQPTIAASGHSGFAVTPNPPHTVRKRETKKCTDCHVSEANDNNAWLANVLGLGTNATNWLGEFAWVAEGKHGIQAVKITEGKEPQPMIGSDFYKRLYPEDYQKFVDGGRMLDVAHSAGSSHAYALEARGEWVFVADGPGGFRVYDRANINRKVNAQRIVANQNSAFGQDTHIGSKDATDVALPTNNPMNLDRAQLPMNLETPVAELFRYGFFTDREEGLISVDIQTFYDNNPRNNYIERAATYNPDGKLSGAVAARVVGNYVYVVSETSGLHAVDVSNPRAPKLVASIGSPDITGGRNLAIQFRYCFVVDKEGMKVVDISDHAAPKLVPGANVSLDDARGVFTIRQYAYVSAGRDGIAIVDITNPEELYVDQMYNADGQINDANAFTSTTVNATTFGVVADGKNGIRILSLIGPGVPGHLGFSPRPMPQLIATYKTKGDALALGQGIPRDRPVDEDGNQIGVGGRLGSHPMTKADMDAMLRRNGQIFTVSD